MYDPLPFSAERERESESYKSNFHLLETMIPTRVGDGVHTGCNAVRVSRYFTLYALNTYPPSVPAVWGRLFEAM